MPPDADPEHDEMDAEPFVDVDLTVGCCTVNLGSVTTESEHAHAALGALLAEAGAEIARGALGQQWPDAS